MRVLAVAAFLGGLLLAVRVMFFGVQRRVDDEHLAHRRWPLALAAFLVTAGAMLYVRASREHRVTAAWAAVVIVAGCAAGSGAWWLVQRSAAVPSTDPEDDPRYRFQGHVARVIKAIGLHGSEDDIGRIAFDFDGKTYELNARWSADEAGAAGGEGEAFDRQSSGLVNNEVVIERVEADVAYVEPWTVVEERL